VTVLPHDPLTSWRYAQTRVPARPWWQFPWLNRSRRVLLALACVWVVHIFDLGFSQLELYQERFRELNPIAARFLNNPSAITLYKFSLLFLGTSIVLTLRRWKIAEWGAWLMLVVSIYLAIRWHCYYASLATGVDNPFVTTN
jgi:hypothetical protein